jgi:polar amino acid transport system substrate-binding protein
MNVLVAALVSVLLITGPGIAADITIVADEWAPYCGRHDAAQPGYGVELVKQIFEAAGYSLVYRIKPWTRAIADTRAGKHNAIIGAFKEEAPDFVFPEEEFGVAVYAVYARAGNDWKYDGLASLRGLSIGVIKDYSYGEAFNSYFKKNTARVQYVHGQNPLYQNLRKLLSGRIDVLIAVEDVISYKAKEMGVSAEIVNAGRTGVRGKLYVAFSPAVPESVNYAGIVTEGIRRLRGLR